MEQEKIQALKQKIARGCVVLLICITVLGTVMALTDTRTTSLRKNITNSKIDKSKSTPSNSTYFESQKQK